MTAEALSSTPPVLGSANPPKTAFVFAGGGSFGSVQVGMLRALLSHGVTADIERLASGVRCAAKKCFQSRGEPCSALSDGAIFSFQQTACAG
jgi:hypothetical protein